MSETSGFVDLHAHSTASDGSRAPGDVVRAACDAGLLAVALTDHDTVAGVPEAATVGRALGIRVVAGVELSAVEGASETHVLGLHLADLGAIEDRLGALREMRLTRAQRIVRQLDAIGVHIDLDDVLLHAGGGAVGRPHVARALIGAGWAKDARDAFDRYLGNGRPAFVAKEQLPLAEAIAIIQRAGGLAVLAHPAQSGTRARIEALAAAGLDGVEVRHPSHSAEDAARLGALVDHFGLVPSGGSDWHGASDGTRTLGVMKVPARWLERQDDRLARRAAA